nr:AIM24 family protein [Paenibacillus sp. RC343]
MSYEIVHEGAFAMLKVQMNPGETIKAEMGAMVSMSSSVDIKGTVDGGLLRGLGRMLSGEKFFFSGAESISRAS